MNKREFYKKIDYYERKILQCINVDRKSYKKGSMNHLDVHYLIFGLKNKIPIMIVHGFGATGITNFKLLPSLIKNFKVILVDLPGFGKSDRSQFEFTSREKTLKFFVMPLVSLVNYLKLQKFIIIAHSLGAFLTSHLVPYLKPKIAAVFLVGAAGFTYKKFSKNETEVLVDEFSKKWELNNNKMVNLARYVIFEKKLPIFNYLPKNLIKKYIESYFMMKDMVLTLKERNLMINYFLVVSELDPCGENALWHMIDFGGYSEQPIINIILENREIDFFVYYGEHDYLDIKDA